jgi:hypothetical protein
MIKVTKINDIKCKGMNLPKVDPSTVKGYEMIGGNLTPNIFCVGSSGSGKTSLLFDFIRKCCDKSTEIYFFVSTFFNDDSYDVIRDYCDKKEIQYHGFDQIGNELKEFMKTKGLEEKNRKEQERLQQLHGEDIEPGEKQCNTIDDVISMIQEDEETFTVRLRKPKKRPIKILFVFDDMSGDLRNATVKEFMKNRRHYGVCNWIASQNLFDLDNHARNNINIFILFGSLTKEKLKQFYDDANLWVDEDVFLHLYNFATTNAGNEKNFLYINKNTREFRKNFNERLDVN